MRRTRLSLLYLAGYLLPTGIALTARPRATMTLLQAQGEYGEVLPRLVGILLLALGIIVAHIIRARAEALYPGTLAARVVILAGLIGLYLQSLDPFFVVVTAVVGVGFLLTLACYLADRQSSGSA
jgi:uncharacterized protein YjeT (DUF2065 family)